MAEEFDSSSLGYLNVGGRKCSTSVGTLNSASMFSGRHILRQDKKGYVFIDRDGKHFRHILNWLRDGGIPKLEDSQYTELAKEAKYHQILELVDGILDVLNSKEDTKLSADITRNDVIKYIHSKKWYRRYLQGVQLFDYVDTEGASFDNADLHGSSFVGAKHYDLDRASCVEGCSY